MSKNRQFVLWTVAAIAATAGLVAVLIEERRAPARRHASYVIGIPEKGAELFFGEKRCSTCHSVNGKGGHLGPDLGSIHPSKPAMGWLASALWNHAPAMWGHMGAEKPPRIDQEEMAHLLAFLHHAGSGDRPGDAAAGRRIFMEKGCDGCHRRVAAPRNDTAWAQTMWDHARSKGEAIKQRLGEWPEFTGDEMNDLIAFVSVGPPEPKPARIKESSLRGGAERGWNVFEKKCMRCHSVGGNGGRIGPELGPDYNLPQGAAQFAAVLWNHAPSMLKHAREASTTMPELEGAEIRDVQTFLNSLQYFEPRGSRFLGERVFTERGCARCHGTSAEGTREGPKLRAGSEAFTTTSLASALWMHGPEMHTQAQRLGVAWPTLESTDIGDLISFLNHPIQKN